MKLPKIGKPKKLIKLLRSFKPSGIEAMIACGLVFATAVMIAILPKNGKTAAPAASEITDWGLNFSRGKNKTPTGNVSQKELDKYGAFYCDDEGEKVVYLTFDAGYENGCAGQILDVLKKEQVPAAFFLVGNYFKTQPELVRRMVEEGHIVGNHTTTHPDMSKISDLSDFRKELEQTENLYREVTGSEMPKFYRPPQGKFSISNLQQAQMLGYTTVFWSLAYADWDNTKQPTKEFALEKLNSRIHDGAIVLLHLTSKTNAEILEELIKGWKEQGYTFKPLTELNH